MRNTPLQELADPHETVTAVNAETGQAANPASAPVPTGPSTATPSPESDPSGSGGDFIVSGGLAFAGHHLIADFWGARHLNDIDVIDAAMRAAAAEAGATVLAVKLHHFSPYEGVTGIALLAESHISIHTWPERDFAALDVFMCGETEPMRAIEVLRERLQPTHVTLAEHKRGVVT